MNTTSIRARPISVAASVAIMKPILAIAVACGTLVAGACADARELIPSNAAHRVATALPSGRAELGIQPLLRVAVIVRIVMSEDGVGRDMRGLSGVCAPTNSVVALSRSGCARPAVTLGALR